MNEMRHPRGNKAVPFENILLADLQLSPLAKSLVSHLQNTLSNFAILIATFQDENISMCES
jgi:hypothetical protein